MNARQSMAAAAIVIAMASTIASGETNTPTSVDEKGSVTTKVQQFKVGQAVKLGDFQVKVLSVKDPFKSANEFDKPAKGTRYIAVDTQVTNAGDEAQMVSSLACFNVSDATGQQYTMGIVIGAPKPPDGEIAPGRTLRGTLVYEIPVAQKKGLILDFKCDFLSSGSATILLK